MKKYMFAMFALMLLVVQGCSQSTKEDIKDLGQDAKNAINKATD